MYVTGNNRRASCDAIYFDSFGVEHIPKEIKKFIGNKNRYLQNTSILFKNMWIRFYWIY